MTIIEWDGSLAVGHAVIDEQLKTIVDIINRLQTACTNGVEQKELRSIFSELFRYTTYHFSEEEALMCESASKIRHAHKLEHSVFVNALSALTNKFEEGEEAIVEETLKFIIEWLRGHITVTDRQLVACLQKSV